MITLSLESVFEYLQKKKLDVKMQENTKQILMMTKVDNRDYPVFIRVLADGTLLQVVSFLPSKLQQKTTGDVGRLLHLFNKELDSPGFGMDESSGLIFYRSLLPGQKGKIETSSIDTCLNTISVVCQNFSPAIEALAAGLISFDEVVARAVAESSKQR